jgi:tetratricopeptide (TPR) repeat protein
MKSIIRFLTIVLVLVSIVSIIGCSSGSQEGTSNNPAAVQMMKMLPANLGGFSYMDISEMRADDYGASVLEYLNSEANLDLSEQVNGFGMLIDEVEGEGIYLYEGNFSEDFSLNQMIENSAGLYNYGGFSIWTIDEYNSVTMINNISICGRDSIIKRCIAVVNDGEESLYDSAKDVVDRLPAGFELGVSIVDSGFAPEGFSGLLAEGISVVKQGDSNVGTAVLKFNSTETARHCTECDSIFYNHQSALLPNPSGNADVKIDDVFVTVVTTSVMPTLDAGQYNSLCFQAAGEGNMSQVIYYCSKSIELNPNYALVYSYRGMTYSSLGDYDKALADYDQYIMLYPDDAFGYYRRGILHQFLGHETEAIADFNKCLSLNPDESIRQQAETALQELGVTP